MRKFRDIGHNWEFSQEEISTLDRYFYGSKLLESCLSKDCYVSRNLREMLEQNILLPIQDELS